MNDLRASNPVLRALAALVLVAPALAAGCGGSSSEPEIAEPPPPASPAPMAEPAPMAAPADTAPAEPATPPAAPAEPAMEPLSDAQIVMIADVSNSAEIETSKLAQTKAKDAKVKKFAAMMVKDHGAAQKKQATLVKQAKITPAESPLSTGLKSEADSGMQSLKDAKGADFDRAYVALQVKLHQDTLDALDKRLLPSAQNPELKTLLTEMRATVEAHLAQVKELQASLGEGTK